MANNAYEDVKSFVSGPALHQSFSRIKTWTSGQITSAITTHNSNKTHVPVCSTAGTYKFLKGVANGAPTWSDIPTSSAINSNTNDTLATSAAVNALNNNLDPLYNRIKIFATRTNVYYDIDWNGATYGAFIVLGMQQYLGAVALKGIVNNGTVSIKNMMDDSDWGNTIMQISFSSSKLRFKDTKGNSQYICIYMCL